MVIKLDFQLKKREIPKGMEKEIMILENLGLEEYEIEYIVYLKAKEVARKKWA